MDFEAIDRYLSFCHKTDSSEDVLLGLDQKVPQSDLLEEDVMFSDETLGKDISKSAIMQVFLADDLPMVDPTPSNGPVYVSEVSDHSVHRGSSPTELYDLDQNSGHDVTLYDDSIRIKQEPGLDIKKECVEPPCHSYQNPAYFQCEEQIFRNMETQIIQDLKSDIEAACRYLKIGSDPMCWCPSDVQKWVAWQCAQYNVLDCKPQYFHMNGTDLCSLSEDDFKRLALSPLAGTTLYSQLDIWRSACDLPVGQTTYPYPPYQQHHNQQHYNVFQIPVPSVSPTPSSDSDDDSMSGSSQGSTSPHMIHRREEDYQGFYSRSTDDKLPDDMDHKQTIQLWQFLKQLLLRPEMYNSCIKWVDRSRGIFKIEDSARVARLWGRRKNRPAMNYDKLSRSIRQYYKKGIIKKTEHSKRLVYQFCQPYL